MAKQKQLFRFLARAIRFFDHRMRVILDAKIVFVDARGCTFELRVVKQYPHLGGISIGDVGIMPEMKHRMQGAIPKMNKRLKIFLKDKEVELKPRINATKTWIFGKILHLCETWPILVQSEIKYLHTNFVKIFKVVLSCDFSSDEKMYLSDFAVLEKTFGVPPRLFVGCRRLAFLSKLLHTKQHHVIVLTWPAIASKIDLGSGLPCRMRSFLVNLIIFLNFLKSMISIVFFAVLRVCLFLL